MWGGRFAEGPSAVMREINASIPFDKRLWRQDIAASRIHIAMLAANGIVSQVDADAIEEGLDRIEDEYEADGVPEDAALEDIHMHVEHRLAELIGPAAGRLHTARSRNDQVATDLRLFVDERQREIRDALDALCDALVAKASANPDAVMPGYTHKDPGRTGSLDPAAWQVAAKTNPLQRLAEPDDIAVTVKFLLSAEAGHITGAVLPVDGGLTLS